MEQERRFIGFHAGTGLREWLRKRAFDLDCPLADTIRRELEFARFCRGRGIVQHSQTKPKKGKQ